MFPRPALIVVTAAALLLSVASVACDELISVQRATPTSPPAATATAAPPASQAPAPTATQPPPTPATGAGIGAAPTPTPYMDGNDGSLPRGSTAGLDSQKTGLTTPEVVKILRPSVVQVVTQILTTGIFNQPVPERGVGTGIILDTEGHIITNNHVVAGARSITVTLDDGESYPAEVIGTDDSMDLAVIRVQADGLTPARLGESSKLEVGEDVIAIGQALGLTGGPTVTKGVVSAMGRSIEIDVATTLVDLIQTDAEINPGNSGGPLVNGRAEVVGINTAIIQSGRGIGFAINIDDAKEVIRQLIDQGFVNRGFLGISPVSVSPSIASRFNLPVNEGILVTRVITGTSAARAGLLPGDVIVQMGEMPIRNTGELSKFLIAHPPGETVDVAYYRNGIRQSTQVTLGERPR